MKLQVLLISASCLVANAFGVAPVSTSIKKVSSMHKAPAFKAPSSNSALFRDPTLTRGGAVPGWAAYNEALDKKPIITKALTSLVGWGLGDALAQIFIGSDPFDLKRLVTLSAFGFLYHGPSGHYFYNWLDSKIEGSDAVSVFSKVAIDQIFWCPIFMSVYFGYLGLVGGDSLATIGNKIRSDLFTAVQGSWKVWPFVHAINFKFISNKHRLVFINGVQVGFNMFLSLLGTK